jgi:NitT/TauT family transport system permease protein
MLQERFNIEKHGPRWAVIMVAAAILAGSLLVSVVPRGDMPVLLYHGIITTQEAIAGFLLALVSGLALGVLLFMMPRVAAVIWPTILFFQITPKVAIAPLLLVWFGFGTLPKIVIAFLISFFPVLSNALVALRSVDEDILGLAGAMRVSRLDKFRYFLIPHTLPQIFAGARIAITFAIIGAVVGEFVGSDAGLGYLVILGARTLDTPLLTGAVVALAVLGILLYGAVVMAEQMTIPWDFAKRRTAASQRLQPISGGL